MYDKIESKNISNWDKPEGKLGMFVIALIIGAISYGLYKVLPFLLNLAWGILELSLAAGLITIVIFLLTNKQIRLIAGAWFFIMMKKLRSLIVETDPIAIVEKRLRDMKYKIVEISKAMGDLTGIIKSMEKRLVDKEDEFQKQIIRKQVSERDGNNAAAEVANRQSVRLSEVIANLNKRLTDSRSWLKILTKLEEMANLTVEDTENAIAVRKEEFEEMKQQHKAFKSVMSVMKGDPDDMALFNEAMEFMEHDINAKLGEMEHVLKSTGGLLQSYDTENGVANIKADELLERYNKEGMKMFEAFDKKELNTNISKNINSNKVKLVEMPITNGDKKYF